MGTVLVIVMFLMYGGAGILIGYYVKRLESAKELHGPFEALAAEHGFTYVPFDDQLTTRWSGKPFGRGRSRRAKNILTGVYKGYRFVAFNYKYVYDGDANSPLVSGFSHGIVAVWLPGQLPWMEVTRRTTALPAEAARGLPHLRSELEAFNRFFSVTAYDARFAHAVINPRTIHLLMTRVQLPWRFEGDTIVGWAVDSHTPDMAMDRLDLLCQVLDNIPPFVWRDYAHIAPPRPPD